MIYKKARRIPILGYGNALDAAAKSKGIVLSDKTRIGVVNLASDVFVPLLLFYQKEGFSINLMETGGDCSRYNASFDCILIWAGAQTTPDQVRAFTKIVKHAETKQSPPQAQPPSTS